MCQHKEKLSVYGQLQRRLKKGLTISSLQASAKERGIAVHQHPTVHQLDQEIKTLQAAVKACHIESAEKSKNIYYIRQISPTTMMTRPEQQH